MRILHVVASVDPALGGVAESIVRRGLRLVEAGHSIEVASLDDPDLDFVATYALPLHALGPARTHWRYSPNLRAWLAAHCRRFDCVIVEGIWQYHAYATRAALRGTGVPYFVFPHGMLDPWFKREYPAKHFKKWLFWPWADYRVLRDASAVLFTCEEERRVARESFWLYRAVERVVPFGTSVPLPLPTQVSSAFFQAFPALRDRRYLLFLSRIHPKKGCDNLLRAFAQLASDHPDLELAIAGSGEVGVMHGLQALADRLGIAARTHWLGMISGDVKWGAIAECDAFVLPSHQENFGIAVVEAIACGKAALISNKVNIHPEIASGGAGYVDDDTVQGTERLLRRWLATPEATKADMARNGLQTFNRHFSIDAMALGLLEAVKAVVPHHL